MTLPADMVERLRELLERVEKCEGADREIDARVYLHFVDERNVFDRDDGAGVCYRDFERQRRHMSWDRVPNYTASLDATYRLMCAALPGYGFILREDEDGCYGSLLYPVHNRVTPGCKKAATPTLALLAAMLQALTASHPGHEEGS